MRRLTDISTGSVSTLLPVYPYYSVLVSDTFLVEATNRLSDTFLDEATGREPSNRLLSKVSFLDHLKNNL